MLKIANQILDVYDDVTYEGIKKLAKANPTMTVLDQDSISKLDATQFGLSIITKEAHILNKFPLVDHDTTFLSNAYFDMNHRKLPVEAQKTAAYHIKQACEKFQVEPTPAVAGMAPEAVKSNIYFEGDVDSIKTASVKEIDLSDFAQVGKIAENYTSAQYIMSTPSRVKLAEKYFNEYHGKMPLEVRTKYAQAIQKRAHELGMEKCAGKVGVYASDSYSAHLDAHLTKRASLLEGKPVMRQFLKKLGGIKDTLSPKEFAQTLYAFDKRAGLNKYYDGYLTNAYETTLGLENPSPNYLYKTAKASLTEDELKNLVHAKADVLSSYLGKQVVDEMKKYPQVIFESLPMDHKEIVVRVANGQL